MKERTYKIKYIKYKNEGQFREILYKLIMRDTNSPLISIGISRACRKFITELKTIPLSEELQKYPLRA